MPITTHSRKTMPTRSIKGRDGNHTQKAVEIRKEPKAAVMAAFAVVFFQNIASRNIATTPGVKKPVNSWMY